MSGGLQWSEHDSFADPAHPLTPKGNSARWVLPWGARGCVVFFYFNYPFYKTVVHTSVDHPL